MKIKIEDIINHKDVRFCSDYGIAQGLWQDDSKPELKNYYVEIDIERIINFSDISIEETEKLQIQESDNGTIISGLLSEIDENGCAILLFENNIIEVLVDMSEERFLGLCGKYITFGVDKLLLYDEHII